MSNVDLTDMELMDAPAATPIEIEDMDEFPLASDEKQSLARCEAIIARGVQTFVEVGEALTEIRDGKLYRMQYQTFDAYCKERWGIGSSRARQLIGASAVARQVETVTNVTLPNEGQARAIAKAAPSDRPAVLNRADQIADGEKRTAKHIEQAAAEIAQPDLPPEFAVIQRRYETHDHVLSPTWDGVTRRYVVRKQGGTGVVMLWPDVLSKLERLEDQQEYDAEHPEQVEARSAPAPIPPAPTLADLDATLPAELHKAGYFWHSATPPTIRNNDGWQGDAPTIEGALQCARDRERVRANMLVLPPMHVDDLPALLKSIAFVLEQWPQNTRGQAEKALGLLRAVGRKALEMSEKGATRA